jgi:hypothetical protein
MSFPSSRKRIITEVTADYIPLIDKDYLTKRQKGSGPLITISKEDMQSIPAEGWRDKQDLILPVICNEALPQDVRTGNTLNLRMEFSMCLMSRGFCFASSAEALFNLAGASRPTFEIRTSIREINLREYYHFAISKDSKIRLKYHFWKTALRLSYNSQS